MKNQSRKIAFVLASSDHGAMIVNRFDYRMVDQTRGFGVGFQILETSGYDREEVDLSLSLLELRRKYVGDGVVAIDCGANIGVHTIEWARRMSGWGYVFAIEAQERLFYALAGNIAINNCFNAKAIFAAVAADSGAMDVPQPNYLVPASFGSLELKKSENNEFIGQKISYDPDKTSEIQTMTLDSLSIERIDLIKIDIEGMELEGLRGAMNSIQRSHPVLIVESIKADPDELRAFLERLEYKVFVMGLNFLAVHKTDKVLSHISQREKG